MQELKDCIWEVLKHAAQLPSLAAEGLLDCIDLREKAAQALQQHSTQLQPSQATSFGRKAVQVGLCSGSQCTPQLAGREPRLHNAQKPHSSRLTAVRNACLVCLACQADHLGACRSTSWQLSY